MSGWLGENKIFEITTENLKWLINLPAPGFHEKADKILSALEKGTVYAGQPLILDISWLSLGRCINKDELNEVIRYLE